MDTAEPRLLRVEVVADLPVLWATLQGLDFPATVDRHFPPPPHWKGPLSPGEVLALWLLFLISQGDHCLNHIAPWVAQHQGTLSALLGKEVLPNCAHDDRLADWLTRLGGGDAFGGLERELNQQTTRVYQLPTDTVRIDTTTANSYAEVLSEQGLLQFGHSKDDPDRPHLQTAPPLLDPLGMPLTTAVVPRTPPDDPVDVPPIEAVRQSFGTGGRTYIGDCKMAALGTRAVVAAGRDFYLCPRSEKQLSRAERRALLQPVWEGTQALQPVWRPGGDGQPDERVAGGVRGRCGVDRPGGRGGSTLDGAPLAGAFAGVRAGPGSGPGAASGEGHRGLAGTGRAQAGQEAAVSRGTAGGGRGHRPARRG